MTNSKKIRLYKISKNILILSLIIFIIISITFSIINHKLQYEMPAISIIKLYDNNEEEYLSLCNGTKQSYVKLNNISGYLIDAFISLEDKRFYSHQGVDIIRVFGALFKNIKANSYAEGASTITQQYVKNLFLSNEKKLKRKIYEAFIAINIENKYSKDQILEGYLNSIYFDHGIYGVEDASIYYFGKSSSELSLLEAVTLASIPKSPVYYSPIKNPSNNKKRRELALMEMLHDNFITKDEYNQALLDTTKIVGYNPKTDNDLAPWFQDAVIKELTSHKYIMQQGYKGLKVYTTLDMDLTRNIIQSIEKRTPDTGIEVAVYAVEPSTGKVLAIIGGKDYQESTYNRALHSARQPGSTVKPFLYLSALEKGFTVASTFRSEKTTFYLKNGTYSPSNFMNIYANMDISMAYAIATSDNIYAMKTHLFLGEQVLANTLKRFGITSEIAPLPSLALGTIEVSLAELTNCYSVLANLGIKNHSSLIDRIETIDGDIIYENKEKPTRVADETDCYLLNEAMTSVFDNNMTYNIRPTCANIASLLKNKYSAKSGSTDTDNWIFGYNQDIAIGVWTGYDDNRDVTILNDLRFGKYIWADSVENYLRNKNTTWYETPSNVMKVELNPTTGFYPTINEYAKYMYFRKDNLPWFIDLLY